jgi:iron complex outermembrane receptor protein
MYSRGDIDGGYGGEFDGHPGGPGFIPFTSESADGIPTLSQITEELRIASNGTGGFNWLLGAYYFNEDVDIDSFSYNSYVAGNPQNGYATQASRAPATPSSDRSISTSRTSGHSRQA